MNSPHEDYVLLDYEVDVDRPLNQLPRKDARALFNSLIGQKRARIAHFLDILEKVGLGPLDTRESMRRVEAWMMASAGPEPGNPDIPSAEWLSFCWDFGLYIGDHIVSTYPHCSAWELSVKGGKTELNYQYPIVRVSGFAINPIYYLLGVVLNSVQYGKRELYGDEDYAVDKVLRWSAEAAGDLGSRI